MPRLLFDTLGRGLKIKQCAAAGRAGHKFSLGNADARSLQDVVEELKVLLRRCPLTRLRAVPDAIAKKRTEGHGGLNALILKKSPTRVAQMDGIALQRSPGLHGRSGDQISITQ